MHKFAHLSLLWHICCNQSCSGWGSLSASAELNRSKPLLCFTLHRHTLGVLPCAFRVYAATRSLPFSPPLFYFSFPRFFSLRSPPRPLSLIRPVPAHRSSVVITATPPPLVSTAQVS